MFFIFCIVSSHVLVRVREFLMYTCVRIFHKKHKPVLLTASWVYIIQDYLACTFLTSWMCVFWLVWYACPSPHPIILLHKSHNEPAQYSIMHYSVTEICTYLHISVATWCNVVYFMMHYGIVNKVNWLWRFIPYPLSVCLVYQPVWTSNWPFDGLDFLSVYDCMYVCVFICGVCT